MSGLTENGFVPKTLQEIKSELEAEYRASFGDSIDVSPTSVFGQLIGNQAKKLALIWEQLNALYSSFNPATAEGVALDGVGSFVGIARRTATPSSSVIAIFGDLGTVVSGGSFRVRQEETNREFLLEEDVTISLSSIIAMNVSVTTAVDSTEYTVNIAGTVYSYTSDASATKTEIIAGLVAAINAETEPVMEAEDNGDDTMTLLSIDDESGYSVSLDSNLQADAQATPGNAIAVVPGALSVPIGTVNEIVTPVSGIDSVYNYATGTIGTDLETDQEYRNSRRRNLTGVGRGTSIAIRSRLLQDVEGVRSAIVVNNREDTTDTDGRPPHSFEVVVSGGSDEEIAQTIWETMPAGIESVGDITVTIQDSEGTQQDISFSRPTEVYIWMNIIISLYSEEQYPSGGSTEIQDNIVEWSVSEYSTGKDVIRQRLLIPIYDTPGIGEVTITLGKSADSTTPPTSYSETDIAIAGDELAVFDQARIAIGAS